MPKTGENKNFAIANLFYFIFGFGLLASTTMIPQILQTLYGYRAINAGLVLGPGAFVITLLAPVGAQIVQRGVIHSRYLLFIALLIVGISFLHYSHFNLETDYGHYARARALQGLGYAFFFVPLTMIAYSQLRPDQNNKASSLTNLFRNGGGSFGIAFLNTASDRRLEFHQSVAAASLPATSSLLQQRVNHISSYLSAHGVSRPDAVHAAYGYIYSQLQVQAHFLAFMDCFNVIGVFTLIAAPLVLLTRPFLIGNKSSGGH